MFHSLLVSVLSMHLAAAAPAPPVLRAPVYGGPVGLVDSVVIEKKARHLMLFRDGKVVRTYLVALGAHPEGDKLRKGDHRTPEGVFYIDSRQPNSHYHLALHISYPDASHRERSRAVGAEPGGDIMIHGLPNGMGAAGALHRLHDWTNGCVALTDEEIEEIWSVVPIGTPVEIKP